jgi:hypothetical protein
MAAIYLKFLFYFSRKTQRGYLLGGALLIDGAVSVKHSTDWFLENHVIDAC